jgi:hypothetical protein
VGAGPDSQSGLGHEHYRDYGAAVKVTLKTRYGRLEVEFTRHGRPRLRISRWGKWIDLLDRDEIEAFRKAINDVWAATYGRDWQEK